MPFVNRRDGVICQAFARPQRKGHEFVSEDSPEYRAFRNRHQPTAAQMMIVREMRALAIASLQARGELPNDYKDGEIR